jgi:uncharacterized SAM-binding protein YcdF (DUF218 family)
MRGMARAAGVPDAAMLLDMRSTSTFENAVETAQVLRDHGLSSVLLVSDGYHLPRARLLFRLCGVAVAAISAAPPGSLGHRLTMAAREVLTIPANVWRLARHRARRVDG